MALDAHTHLRHTPAEDDAHGLDAGEGEAYTSAEGRECMIFSTFPKISDLAKQLPIQTIHIQQEVIHADKPDKEAPQLPGQLGSLYWVRYTGLPCCPVSDTLWGGCRRSIDTLSRPEPLR